MNLQGCLRGRGGTLLALLFLLLVLLVFFVFFVLLVLFLPLVRLDFVLLTLVLGICSIAVLRTARPGRRVCCSNTFIRSNFQGLDMTMNI